MDIIDTIYDLFGQYGDCDYGEDVSQRDHALQVAHVARADGAPDALVAAGLLHDIGQFFEHSGKITEGACTREHHELSGAAFLAPYYPAAVVAPIKLHVAAKRYLCAVETGYQATLSHASTTSLAAQGGPFDRSEVAVFRRLAHARDAIRLRRYDDLGKQPDCRIASLEFYRPMLIRLRLPEPSV